MEISLPTLGAYGVSQNIAVGVLSTTLAFSQEIASQLFSSLGIGQNVDASA